MAIPRRFQEAAEVSESEAALSSVFEIPVSLIDMCFVLMIFFIILQVEAKEKSEASKNLAQITVPTVANRSANIDNFKASLFIGVIRDRSTTRYVLIHNQLTDSLGDKSQMGIYKNMFRPIQWPSLENPSLGVKDANDVQVAYYGSNYRVNSLDRLELTRRFEALGPALNGKNAKGQVYTMKIVIQAEQNVPYKDVMDVYALCIRDPDVGGLKQSPANIHFMGGNLSNITKPGFVSFSEEEEE